MKKLSPVTIGFIVIIIALITVFDVWTLAVKGYDTTISWTLYASAKDWPVIPFLAGILCGHLWFPNRAANTP